MLQKNIRYSYSFLDKFAIESKVPNSNDVVLRSRDSQQLILMKQIEVTGEEYQQTQATLEYQKKLSHEQLLALVDYYPQPAIRKFVVLYEYCSISLMDQFENRLSQRRIFSESELWSIFTSLIFGLAYLQEQNVGHGSISLSDCFLNQHGFIKISDPTCATSNPYTILRGYFYAPEILRCLMHDTGEQINIFKSDVFSLGLCMLQLSLMRDVSEIFDYQLGKINNIGLKCLISDFSSIGLSRQYVNFVLELLANSPWDRPDFIQLKAQIFNFLSLDTIDQSQEILRNSYGIKSSLSSLCRSKQQFNITKQPREELENRKIKETKSAMLNAQFETILNNQNDNSSKKSRCPLGQLRTEGRNNILMAELNSLLNDRPNVDHLFGNMKKSIHLGDCQDFQTPTNQYYPKEMKNTKQNRRETSKGKFTMEIAHLQENIENLQFSIKKKRRQRQQTSTGKFQSQNYFWNDDVGIFEDENPSEQPLQESKVQVIQKQLQQLFQSPLLPKKAIQTSNRHRNTNDTKKSHLNNSEANKISEFPNTQKSQLPLKKSQTRHKKSQSCHPQQPRKSELLPKSKQYHSSLEESYTDPLFLQMMKADVEQILNKRKVCFQ